jgi:hypothetical protein
MRKIFKYPLEIIDYQTVEIKSPAILLSVMEIDDEIMMYAMVDDLEYGVPVDVRIIGTDHAIKDDIDNYKFLGTVKLMNGREIWHVFACHSNDLKQVGEKKEEDIPILRIDEFTNFKEKGRSPQMIMA